MKKYYLIKKTKPQRVERNKALIKMNRDKYPISNNEYLSVVEYFGNISMRNRFLIGHLASTFSVLSRVGRTRIFQAEGDEVFEVNRYDRILLSKIETIIPAEILKEQEDPECQKDSSNLKSG